MQRKQQEVWDMTNGHCWYCGIQLVFGDRRDPDSRLYIAQWFVCDHVIPKTHGGSNRVDNLVPACWTCNCQKGHKSVEQYRLYLSMKRAGNPYFSQEQIAWLLQQGFRVPEAKPIEFWAERQGLDFEIYVKAEA